MYPSPKNLLTGYSSYPEAQGAGGDGWFDLEDWVGPQHASKRGDVAKIEGILANSGDYSLERTQGPTGYWGLALDDGIRSYQKRNGLQVDGALRPGGPTIRHMADAFGTLLGTHQPPTPDDIDRHHDVVNDNNPGTIAWQQPPVSFDDIPGLPEIDQETDASNARMVRAMLKTKGFGTYPQLFAKAIDDSGASGLAAVRDLVAKYDEAMPGKGGYLASAVTGLVSEKTQKDLGLEVPQTPPKGVKVAQSVGDLGFAATMAGLLALTGGAKKASDDGNRIAGGAGEFKLPGFTPPDDPDDRTRTRPGSEEIPTTISGPTSTGHPAEQPKASDSIETFPVAPEEKRQQIIDDIAKDLFPNYVEMKYGDRDENRATDENAEITNIIIKTFMDEVKKSSAPDLIHHKYGGSFLGEKKEYKEEKTIPNKVGTFNRPDGTFQFEGADGSDDSMSFNVQTPRKDGTPIEREQKSFDRLTDVLGPDSMKGFPKRLPGQSLEDHTREAVAFGKRLFEQFNNRIWNLPGPR